MTIEAFIARPYSSQSGTDVHSCSLNKPVTTGIGSNGRNSIEGVLPSGEGSCLFNTIRIVYSVRKIPKSIRAGRRHKLRPSGVLSVHLYSSVLDLNRIPAKCSLLSRWDPVGCVNLNLSSLKQRPPLGRRRNENSTWMNLDGES